MSSPRKFQPYFVSYAIAHGRTGSAQLKADKKEYPGACMCGFILWMSKMRQAFRGARPECFLGDNISNHAAWGRFLRTKAREFRAQLAPAQRTAAA